MGYHQAGFTEIVGIDNRPQPNYPFAFIQADALNPPVDLGAFDLIHASPPCQAYSSLAGDGHPDLIPETRALVNGYPHVIENIETAPLRRDLRLCGSMFGLGVRRHRWFEIDGPLILTAGCWHFGHEIRAYYGKPGWAAWVPGDDQPAGAHVQKRGRKPLLRGSPAHAPADMGIDWMTWDELREAIPPAYTRFIGEQFLCRT